MGLYLSDQWRVKPTVTLTGGLRWELQLPFTPTSGDYARLQDWQMVYGVTGPGNMFKPGTMTGTSPVLQNYAKGAKAYNMDWNNAALPRARYLSSNRLKTRSSNVEAQRRS